jgi:hypothetical protein
VWGSCLPPKCMAKKREHGIFRKHSLSIVAGAILLLWVILYTRADSSTHLGMFFGNAIADWTGLFMTVVGTKFLYERGSAESKKPRFKGRWQFLENHSLTIFLVITGLLLTAQYARMQPDSKWGEVVSNLVSEWTQMLGLLLMSKKLFEKGSKESKSK